MYRGILLAFIWPALVKAFGQLAMPRAPPASLLPRPSLRQVAHVSGGLIEGHRMVSAGASKTEGFFGSLFKSPPKSDMPDSRAVSSSVTPSPKTQSFFGSLFSKPQSTQANNLPQPKTRKNFFFNSQSSPADSYNPDMRAKLPGLPKKIDAMYRDAAEGVKAAIAKGIKTVEVDVPVGNNLVRSQDITANTEAAAALKRALGLFTNAIVVQGNDLQDAADQVNSNTIAIVVQPTGDAQWKAAEALGCRGVVILNGLMKEGTFPQAYYYKPMTAFGQVTGGVVRRYPGPYTAYTDAGERVDVNVGLEVQGNRALPDTKGANAKLQETYGQKVRGAWK